jgi:glucose-6-phosphate 1-epimerase
VALALRADDATRATWPHAFEARVAVSLDGGLRMAMEVANVGDAPFAFTGALHAYFRVADVERASVRGLEGATYRDQLARVERRERTRPVRIPGAVDRIYMDVAGPLALHDEVTGRRLRLTTTGFTDAVVWNPAPEGARAIDDLADDEWRTMLCIEPAVAAHPVTVAPGGRWTGTLLVEAGA